MTEPRRPPAYGGSLEASDPLLSAPGPLARGRRHDEEPPSAPHDPGLAEIFRQLGRHRGPGLPGHVMRTLFASRLVRFLFAGGLNTAFGLVVYTALALTALPTLAVVVLSNCIGIAFNFFTSGRMVFRDLSPRRLPRFVLSYGVVILANWLLIVRLSPLVGGRILAMLVIVGPMAALSYLLQSRFVFRTR